MSTYTNITEPYGIALDLVERLAFVATRDDLGNGFISRMEMDNNHTDFQVGRGKMVCIYSFILYWNVIFIYLSILCIDIYIYIHTRGEFSPCLWV